MNSLSQIIINSLNDEQLLDIINERTNNIFGYDVIQLAILELARRHPPITNAPKIKGRKKANNK
jgi:hypothetical protein